MRTARPSRGARTLRLLASASLLAVFLVAFVPTLARAQTTHEATTQAPHLDIDASCSDGVLTIEASGFQAGHFYRVTALPTGSDSGLAFGPERADDDGAFRLTAPLALFGGSCAQHTTWHFAAADTEAVTTAVAMSDVTFGAPSPALAGFGVGREAERTHPALIIAILTVSAAIVVSAIRHRRGPLTDDFDD